MKDDRLYLLHISESLERNEEYVAEGKEAFFAVHHWLETWPSPS